MAGSAINIGNQDLSVAAKAAISGWALRSHTRLPGDWEDRLPAEIQLEDKDFLEIVASGFGWKVDRLTSKPRAHQFPLWIWLGGKWVTGLQWRRPGVLAVQAADGVVDLPWSREVLACQLVSPADVSDGEFETAFGVFWRAVKSRPRMLFEATLATVVVNTLALFTSVYSMQVYDRVIPLHGYATLIVLTIGMLFALLIDFLLRNIRAGMIDREAGEIDAEVSDYFFERMQAVRMDARPAGVGTMAGQLRGLDQIRSAMTSTSLFILADLPFALVFAMFMMSIGGVLAIVPLIFFPASILIAVLLARSIRDATAQAQISGNHKNGLLVEALDAAETIKSTGGDWFMLRAWNRLVEQVHTHDIKIKKWSTIASSAFSALPQLAYVSIVFWGTYRVAENQMTMGGLIACTIISGRITGPLVSALPSMIIQWGYARQSLQALDRILAMPSAVPLNRKLVDLSKCGGRLQLDGVSFGYLSARTALQGISINITSNERIGIIGSVGSGKSTLLRLLGGLYVPNEGLALLDEIDMAQISEADLRRHIAYLPQTYRLISGTLRDNLGMGLHGVSDEDLLAAAAKTGLGDVIRSNPRGLDLTIGEGGRGLSGGQAALVGLTRLLLVRPAVVLLDEPTASLDQDTEARALKAIFSELGPKSTIVLVTHKIQLLGLVQRLVVMAQGRIALDGPTQSVIDRLRAPANAPQQTNAVAVVSGHQP